jgi:hypothetical protein
MQFAIDNANGQMTVGGLVAPIDTTGLAASISIVAFGDGSGGMIYYVNSPTTASFIDPSPYQSYFDAWITAAAEQGMTLMQAQAAKAAFVNSIGLVKQAIPATITTSLGTFSFDASSKGQQQIGLAASLNGSAPLFPLGATTYTIFTAADINNILAVIINRNAFRQATNLSKQAAINALSSIASVASYDATTGW